MASSAIGTFMVDYANSLILFHNITENSINSATIHGRNIKIYRDYENLKDAQEIVKHKEEMFLIGDGTMYIDWKLDDYMYEIGYIISSVDYPDMRGLQVWHPQAQPIPGKARHV